MTTPKNRISPKSSVVNTRVIKDITESDDFGVPVLSFVGSQIRARRHFHGMTITELAAATGLSVGMLSKIENGNVSPSLQTLALISTGLSCPMHSLFRGFDDEGVAWFVPAGKGLITSRPNKVKGPTFELLTNKASQSGAFEPYLITIISNEHLGETFTHNGMKFNFVLEGAMIYRYASRRFHLGPGDSLTFDGRTPHGPLELIRAPVRFLSVNSSSPPVNLDSQVSKPRKK